MVKNAPANERDAVEKICWGRKWQPTPGFLSGEPHEWRNLVGYSPWGCKELDTIERLHFHFQSFLHLYSEKAMVPHSSTLAWKIPWMEEPGRLQSMGSHRVRHDSSDLAAAAAEGKGKDSTCNARAAGDTGVIPESGRFLGEGNGNLLQYSCLENLKDQGALQATVHGIAKSGRRLRD